MDKLDALNFVLDKEKEAVETYKNFSIEHPSMRVLFESLMTEEQKHISAIEKKIAELYR